MSQRIAEAVFAAHQGDPRSLFAAPAGTSGNLGVGGYDTERKRSYIMYLFTGAVYGGSRRRRLEQRLLDHPHLQDGRRSRCWNSSSGCSEEFSLHEGRAAQASSRGGFGIQLRHQAPARRGDGIDGMDHGRTGPQGVLGG